MDRHCDRAWWQTTLYSDSEVFNESMLTLMVSLLFIPYTVTWTFTEWDVGAENWALTAYVSSG